MENADGQVDRSWKRAQARRKPHTCLFCEKVLTTRIALEWHLNGHTQERRYPCQLCGKIFFDPRNQRRHIKRVHKVGNEEPRKVELNQVEEEEDRQENDVGQENGGFKENLENSLEPVETKPEVKQVKEKKSMPKKVESGGFSGTCSKNQINRKMVLTFAVVIVDGQKRFKCPLCPTLLTMKCNARRHMKTVHANGQKKKERKKVLKKSTVFRCQFCADTFPNSRELWIHKKSSHRDKLKLFQCPDCTKAFTDSCNLTRHRKSHGGNLKVLKEEEIAECMENVLKAISKGDHSCDDGEAQSSAQKPGFSEAAITLETEFSHGHQDKGQAGMGYLNQDDLITPPDTTQEGDTEDVPLEHQISEVSMEVPDLDMPELEKQEKIPASHLDKPAPTITPKMKDSEDKNQLQELEASPTEDLKMEASLSASGKQKWFWCHQCATSFKYWNGLQRHRKSAHLVEYEDLAPKPVTVVPKNVETPQTFGGGNSETPQGETLCCEPIPFNDELEEPNKPEIHSGEPIIQSHSVKCCDALENNPESSEEEDVKVSRGKEEYQKSRAKKTVLSKKKTTMKTKPRALRAVSGKQPNIDTVQKQVKCPNCPKSFAALGYLVRHQQKHHPERHVQVQDTGNSEESLKCRFCSKSFSSQTALAWHQKKEHADQVQLSKCPDCPKAFCNRSTMLRHWKSIHQNENSSGNAEPTASASNYNPGKPVMSIAQILQWQRKMQEEINEDKRQQQETLGRFFLTMNRYKASPESEDN